MKVGDRVHHNYQQGHGPGTILSIDDRPHASFKYEVQFDSGHKGPYNDGEIVPLKRFKKKHRPLPGIMGKGHGHKTKKEKDPDWRDEMS